MEEPVKILGGIKFSIWSPVEVRKFSVAEITAPETYDEDGMPVGFHEMAPVMRWISIFSKPLSTEVPSRVIYRQRNFLHEKTQIFYFSHNGRE